MHAETSSTRASTARSAGATLRRWRSPLVVVGASAAVLTGLVLSNDGYDYDAVCVDDRGTRIPETRCDGASGGGAGYGGGRWYYIPAGSRAPAVGGSASGGSFAVPDTSRYSVHEGGVDAHGGKVSRGGFGGRLGSVGG